MKNLIRVGMALFICIAMGGPVRAQQNDQGDSDSSPSTAQSLNDLATQAGALAGQRQANRDAARSAQISAMNTKNACRTSCNSDHNSCAQKAAYARNQPGGIGAAMNACDAQNRICFSGC